MPDFKLPLAEPGRNDTETLQNLLDTMLKYRKELNFLLQNLDADNVLEAKSVIADWIYAGQVTTDQLIAGEAKISTALIEELIVGGNVSMGPDATISWQQIPDVPGDIIFQDMLNIELSNYLTTGYASNVFNNLLAYTNLETVLGEDYIITGKIAANQIATGTLSSVIIDVDTDVNIGDNLYLGDTNEVRSKYIYFNNGARIFNTGMVGADIAFSCNALDLSLAGSVNFGGISVSGLNVTAKFL